MDTRLKSSNNATLLMRAGLDALKARVSNDPEASILVHELQELLRTRAVVAADLTGPIVVALRELSEPIVINPTYEGPPLEGERNSYRAFIHHAEHVS